MNALGTVRTYRHLLLSYQNQTNEQILNGIFWLQNPGDNGLFSRRMVDKGQVTEDIEHSRSSLCEEGAGTTGTGTGTGTPGESGTQSTFTLFSSFRLLACMLLPHFLFLNPTRQRCPQIFQEQICTYQPTFW